MAAPNSSPKSYNVAPAHDASAVQNAVAEPLVVAPRAPELRGEEFDFDPRTQNIEPENDAPTETKPAKWGWLWLLVGIALAYGIYTFGAVIGEKSRRPMPLVIQGASKSVPTTVKVHVAGQINRPGVYDLPFNSRIQDAIRKAGGPKPDADLNALNLADWAQDGGKIEVPARAKPLPIATPIVIIKEVPVASSPDVATSSESVASADKTTKNESGIPLAKTESGAVSTNASVEYLKANPVDLNKATQAQLEVLPGVGPKMAERILAYRAENGGFKSLDELDDVKGIGEKTLETLKPLVKVR